MGGVKFFVHPLTIIFGVYSAIVGNLTSFLVYTISACIHELGHSLVAFQYGCKLDKIILMPYGATITGDLTGLKQKDQIKIALAGPFINIVIGLFFISMWWLFPAIYSFTDIIVEANISLAVINLIPLYPLDGGRIIFCLLCERFNQEKADKICKVLGIILSLILSCLFIVSCFNNINISLLFFSIFCFVGTLEKHSQSKYVRICLGVPKKMLKRGVMYKKQAVDKETKIKDLIKIVDYNCINEVVVLGNGEEIAKLNEKNIKEIIESGEIYSSIGEVLAK